VHNEGLHNMYSLPDIIDEKCEHVARIEQKRNT
jgi:hypothetical protein